MAFSASAPDLRAISIQGRACSVTLAKAYLKGQRMPKKPRPQWQPVSKLPSMAQHIDGWLESVQEQYETMLLDKVKPYVLDDYTVNRVTKAFTEQQNGLWLFDEQLHLWQSEKLTQAQRKEVERLQGQMTKLRETITTFLNLADELAKGTIEKVLAKSDAELGLEFLLNPEKFRR
jgi:hypothetical protein